MTKNILRFLVVTAVAVALGLLIYRLNQPSAASALAGGFGGARELGEHGFGERGFSLARGLSGVAGDVFLIALVTLVVGALRKASGLAARTARTR